MVRRFKNTILAALFLGLSLLIWSDHAIADEFARGIQAMDAGQDDMAIRSFSSYLARRPQTYEALINRGAAFMRSGHVYEAVSDWSDADEVAPMFGYAFYTADILRSVAPKKSPVKYVASIELYPEKAGSVVMTGAAYLDLGLKSRAVDFFRMSVRLTKNPLFKTDLEYWVKSLGPSQNDPMAQP
jgi:hypothetical protein